MRDSSDSDCFYGIKSQAPEAEHVLHVLALAVAPTLLRCSRCPAVATLLPRCCPAPAIVAVDVVAIGIVAVVVVVAVAVDDAADAVTEQDNSTYYTIRANMMTAGCLLTTAIACTQYGLRP